MWTEKENFQFSENTQIDLGPARSCVTAGVKLLFCKLQLPHLQNRITVPSQGSVVGEQGYCEEQMK